MSFINIKYKELLQQYDLSYFLNYKSNLISEDKTSDTCHITIDKHDFILKRFYKPGVGFIKWLSKYTPFIYSKATGEFVNLLFLANNGFLSPTIALFFEQGNKACILVSKPTETLGAISLADFYNTNIPNKCNFKYLLKFISILSKMHQLSFIHNDFRLSNVYITPNDDLYISQCTNSFKINLDIFKNGYVIKELAYVYNQLNKILSAKQLLLLYKYYYKITDNKLSQESRDNLKAILSFF